MTIIETGRANLATPFLKHLVGGLDFAWYVLPPQGRSGGILVGFNEAIFSVQDLVSGDFCIKIRIRNKADGFLWSLVIVYGGQLRKSINMFF